MLNTKPLCWRTQRALCVTIADHIQAPSDAECISGYRLVIPHYVTPVADPHPRYPHLGGAVRRAGLLHSILTGLVGYMQEMDRQCGVNILLT
jgi:hypothetical protein